MQCSINVSACGVNRTTTTRQEPRNTGLRAQTSRAVAPWLGQRSETTSILGPARDARSGSNQRPWTTSTVCAASKARCGSRAKKPQRIGPRPSPRQLHERSVIGFHGAPRRRSHGMLVVVIVQANHVTVLPNNSVKLSPNGMSRWPSSAGPTAHFALAVQHVTPSVPA